MAVVLNITTVPQDFAAGSYNTAASTINAGKWRIVLTPTGSSATFTGGNFHAILGQFDGGLWFNDTNLELYTNPNDDIAFSVALTWSAGQPITLDVDARSGHMTATITGATTGNGTVSLAFPGPYLDPTLLLEVGRQNGGANFAFVGGISDITDGATSDSVTPAAITITGGVVNDKLGFKASVASATVAINGGSIGEGRGGNVDSATPATIASIGGSVSVKRSYADSVSSPAHVTLAGGNVLESPGGQISLGQTAIDFQTFGFASRAASVSVNTPVSGAIVLLSAGGKSTDISVAWTDSKNATSPVTIGALVGYPDFVGYGTIVALTPAPMTGGSAQTFTQAVTAGDENTTFALSAVVSGGHPRVTEVHNNVANASGTTQQTSPTITIDGEALLVAYWWGSSPVIPPFSTPSPGVGTPYTAVPNNGFTVAQSYLVNNEFGEVQAAMAYLYVSAGAGSSTRSVTWTHSPAQGAQLRLVAIQPALSEGVTSALIALTGQSVNERIVYRDTITPATLQISSGTLVEQVQRIDIASSATLTIVSVNIQDRRTFVLSVTPAAVTLAGGAVQDQVANNQKDSISPAQVTLASTLIGTKVGIADLVTPALIAVISGSVQDKHLVTDNIVSASIGTVGGVVQDQRAIIDVVTPAAVSINGSVLQEKLGFVDVASTTTILLVGKNVPELVPSNRQDIVSSALVALVSGVISLAVTRRVSITPAFVTLIGNTVSPSVARRVSVQQSGISLAGSQVLARTARKIIASAAAVVLLGDTVSDLLPSSTHDSVIQAAITVIGTGVRTRTAYVDLVVQASMLLRGTEIRTQVSDGASVVTPPIPPGRAASRLEGRVAVSSIESTTSEQGHLFGVIRSKTNV